MEQKAEIRVREATMADLDILVAGNQAMAEETEGKRLAPEVLREGVRRGLLDPTRAIYLVAEEQGEVAGQLMLTQEWSDWRDGCFLWIQSVYVFPASRRRGVYRALYAEVQRRAREAGDVVGIRLYVEKDNRVAQQTYADLGMEECDYRMYEALL